MSSKEQQWFESSSKEQQWFESWAKMSPEERFMQERFQHRRMAAECGINVELLKHLGIEPDAVQNEMDQEKKPQHQHRNKIEFELPEDGEQAVRKVMQEMEKQNKRNVALEQNSVAESSSVGSKHKRSKKQSSSKVTTCCSKHSLGCKVCKCAIKMSMVFVLMIIVGGIFLYVNCSRWEILPKSRRLCNDVASIWMNGEFSMTWDYAATGNEVRSKINHAATDTVEWIKNIDWESLKSSFIDGMVVIGEKVSFGLERGSQYGGTAWKVSKSWAARIWESVLRFSARFQDNIVFVFRWVADSGREFYDNCPVYLEKVKSYWK